MTIPNPRTWVDNEIVTPDQLNTELRDAVNFILNPPAMAANLVTPQSVARLTWVTMAFDQVTRDTDGLSDLSTPGVYTIQTPGLYLLGCNPIFASNTTGVRHAAIFLNGVNVGRTSRNAISTSVAGGLAIQKSLVLSPGDKVEFKVHQSTAGNLNINGSGDEISSAFILWCAK